MAPHASVLVQLAIPVLALFVLGSLVAAVRRTSGRRVGVLFAFGVLAWLVFSAVLASSGFLSDFDSRPPHLALVMVPALILPITVGFSRIGTALLGMPVALLVGFQAFRFPLELVMHRAAAEGTMPAQMTFSGRNFDIVTGVTALLVGSLAARGRAPRWLLLAWNALGSTLLVVILVIAVASLPAIGAFGRRPEQLNTWVAYFPFVWLPAGLVSAAMLGHVLLWRRLLGRGMRGRAFLPL